LYQASLFLHNILRWIVIIAALFAFVKAIQSYSNIMLLTGYFISFHRHTLV